MGLDQYAYARYRRKKEKVLGVVVDETIKRQLEIMYWRKHPNLQGWMEKLYIKKGGQEQFNCRDVELTIDDINELERVVKAKELPKTSGFFFGSDADEEYYQDDLLFIEKAKEYLNDGAKIFYSSWW